MVVGTRKNISLIPTWNGLRTSPIGMIGYLHTEEKVIAWNPKGKIQGTIRPIRPSTPLGGWSNLSILEWINQ